jgi:septal ring factor EnvC (AmiA/AmiB activator)
MDEERLAEILAAAFEKLGMGEFGKNISNTNKNLSEAQKKQQKQIELYDATAKKFADLNEQLKKGRKQYIDLGEDLKRLNQNIDDVTDPLKREA